MSALDRVLALSRGEAEAVADLDELTLTWSPKARAASAAARKGKFKMSELKEGDIVRRNGGVHRITGSSQKAPYSDGKHNISMRKIEESKYSSGGYRLGSRGMVTAPPDTEFDVLHHSPGTGIDEKLKSLAAGEDLKNEQDAKDKLAKLDADVKDEQKKGIKRGPAQRALDNHFSSR